MHRVVRVLARERSGAAVGQDGRPRGAGRQGRETHSVHVSRLRDARHPGVYTTEIARISIVLAPDSAPRQNEKVAVGEMMKKFHGPLSHRYAQHPGRGGCGVGAVVDLEQPSHDVVKLALEGLGCLEHRGGAIEDTGDGAGLLLRTDEKFFRRFIAPGRRLPDGHRLIVGVLFFPPAEEQNLPAYQLEIESHLRRRGLQPLGWRRVPVDESALGAKARVGRRDVWQVLIGEGMVPHEQLSRELFEVKHQLERWFRDLYIPSLSPRTLVYKALATGNQLRRF